MNALQQSLTACAPVVLVSHGFQINYERGFSNGLAAAGQNVTLISSDRSDDAGLLPEVKTVNLRGSQEEARPRWRKALNMLRYHLSLCAYALLRCRSVFHVMGLIDPPVLCGVFEGLWFRLVCRRYVLTVHNLLPHDRHTARNRQLYRLAYRLPHALVVHTSRMRDQLHAEFGVPAHKITVMEHGIEPAVDIGDWGDARAADNEPLILVFGRIAPYKGVDLLLEALRGADFPFRLVIAGVCQSADYRARLTDMIKSHPHAGRIEWQQGFIQEEQMQQLFKSADLLALPYRHIDQSGVLFQALRYGVPILATRVGQFADYVPPEVGELADPDDAAALATALQRWALRWRSLSREQIRSFGKSYEWPMVVQELEKVYRP